MSDHREKGQTPSRSLQRLERRLGGWSRVLLVAVGAPIVRRLFPLRVEGDEHVPASGPAIIAANHLSFFDHVALVCPWVADCASSERSTTSTAGRRGSSCPRSG